MTEPLAGAARPGANTAEYSVSELANAIKRALEDGFGYVKLKGEISGYRGPHSSGHCYFALKDDKAKIEAVIWRGVFSRLRIKPEEGMEVVAQGKITTFPGSSKYQIVIEALEPAGIGALMAILEERKRKLTAEGLFEDARKKKLPFLPRVVGIVTSPTGAVIRDMLHGFKERFPTRVLVWPVRVQGETSAAEVAAAVRGFNAIQPGGQVPRPDVLIVARGGGSLEDLWGFNDEAVVRAVAESRIPLISAVGHETDWTLIDLAADARAPTPTKAAEWAVPKYSELLTTQTDLSSRLAIAIRRQVEGARTHLKAAARGLPRLQDLVALPRQRFDAAEKRLVRALMANTHAHHSRYARIAGRLQVRLVSERLSRSHDRLDAVSRRATDCLGRAAGRLRARFEGLSGRLRLGTVRDRLAAGDSRLIELDARSRRAIANFIAHSRRRLDSQVKLLRSLSYQGVLERGFALIRDEEDRMVRSASAVAKGARLEIEFADGRVPATAIEAGRSTRTATASSSLEPEKPEPENTSDTRPARPRRGPGGQGQGSLF